MNRGKDALTSLIDHLAVHYTSSIDENEVVTWTSSRKGSGWIIPIATGFQGISELEFAKYQRDETTPHRFAESVITLGEFIMLHKINTIEEVLWKYSYNQERKSICLPNKLRRNHMAKNKSKEKVTVLAFEKKLIPSDGYFYGTTWDNSSQLVPLKLREKAVRGTISNRLKMTTEKDYLGLDAKVENANLQTVDTCSLSQEQDTLVVKFSLKVIGGLEKPSACNNSNFLSSYKEAVKKYKETYGFSELASRYALNIANGRFLWRNRVGVENILVTVELENEGLDTIYEFDSNSIGLDNFEYSTNEIASLAQHIEKVLLSSDDYLLMKITCKARLGLAQEVYPSEELVLDSNSKEKR